VPRGSEQRVNKIAQFRTFLDVCGSVVEEFAAQSDEVASPYIWGKKPF
jgi:hypothetical protein